MVDKMLQNTKCYGFSLIEIVVTFGIFALMLASAYDIGLPQYNRYVVNVERRRFVDTLLEARSLAMASDKAVGLSCWTDGYCETSAVDDNDLADSSPDFCLDKPYYLPNNIKIKNFSGGIFSSDGSFSTTTVIDFSDYKINVDQNGFVDGR